MAVGHVGSVSWERRRRGIEGDRSTTGTIVARAEGQ
jgi:hypothetical protein